MSAIHLLHQKCIPLPLTYALLIIILHSSIVLAQSCYFPSGALAPSFTPCNGTASASHCCSPSDACLTSSLCYMKWDHSINVGTCTDKTWRDPTCFQLCPKTSAYKVSVTNTLYRCNDNNWCCSAGGNTTSCCNDPGIDLFTVGQGDIFNGSAWSSGLTLGPIPAEQTSSATSSTTAKSCPTQTIVQKINETIRSGGDETQEKKDDDDDDETKKVGMAVGFGVGVPSLIALFAAMFLLRREKRSNLLLRQQLSDVYAQPGNLAQRYGFKNPYEMSAREEVVNEMPTQSENIPELYEDRLGR